MGMASDKPLWVPDPARVATSAMSRFRIAANGRFGLKLATYRELHAWSVMNPAEFWELVWDFCGVIGDKGERRLVDIGRMPGARFFPDAKLNFAENLLRRRSEATALVFRGEDKTERHMSFAELEALVSRLQQALVAAGVGVGDRVAAMLPNMPEAIALMLATSSIGAIFSSCSPDFGERGVLDRFGQIEPKLFFAVRRLLVRRQAHLDCGEAAAHRRASAEPCEDCGGSLSRRGGCASKAAAARGRS